jgi:hypothetical protein
MPGSRSPSYNWNAAAVGVVYLFRCERTGISKLGATVDPFTRFNTLTYTARLRGFELQYIWSIATNGVGRAETFWRVRWKPYLHHGREWFELPEAEVAHFKTFGTCVWNDLPAPNPEWWECVHAGRAA